MCNYVPHVKKFNHPPKHAKILWKKSPPPPSPLQYGTKPNMHTHLPSAATTPEWMAREAKICVWPEPAVCVAPQRGLLLRQNPSCYASPTPPPPPPYGRFPGAGGGGRMSITETQHRQSHTDACVHHTGGRTQYIEATACCCWCMLHTAEATVREQWSEATKKLCTFSVRDIPPAATACICGR